MSQSTGLPENQSTGQGTPGMAQGVAIRCSLPARPQRPEAVTSDLCNVLEEAGCPLAALVQDRLRFETLLADLSATFVKVPASQVDSQIESALRRLVEFLEVDWGALAEVLVDQKQLVVTHSYQAPGMPLMPRMILNEELPWYAKT